MTHLCPDCKHPLAALTDFELWCSNCGKSWNRQAADAALAADQRDAAEHRAEILADARAEADVDEDARADAYEKGFGW